MSKTKYGPTSREAPDPQSSKSKPIDELIRELPSELQEEVFDFVEFLLDKRVKKKGKRLKQDWAGALSEYRGQYTALELQKKAMEWRGD